MSSTYYVHPATRDEIFAKFCNINIDLQDCMNTSRKVIDSEQYLYDWVRKTVHTRADYVLHRNALHGVLDYGLFLRMQIPGNSHNNHHILRLFVSSMTKLLDELAEEKGFAKPPVITTGEKARQVFLQIEKIPRSVMIAALQKCDMSYTEFLRSEITVLAQNSDMTLDEYLGPATDLDISQSIAYFRKVLKRYESSAEKVLYETPNHLDCVSHATFLIERCQEFSFSPLILDELKRALVEVSNVYPAIVRTTFNTTSDLDIQILAEIADLLNKKPVK